jgi:hypothetical protein
MPCAGEHTPGGVSCEPSDFATLTMPAIVFWNFNHYVVLEGRRQTFRTEAGVAITPQNNVGWLASAEAELTHPDGEPVPRFETLQAAVLAPGLWVTAARPADAILVNTAEALQQSLWWSVLAGFHQQALITVNRHLIGRETASLELAQARSERTTSALDRTLGRFAGALDHAPAWTGAAAPDERLRGPFVMVCEAVGIDLTQRMREAIRRINSVEEQNGPYGKNQRRRSDQAGPFVVEGSPRELKPP